MLGGVGQLFLDDLAFNDNAPQGGPDRVEVARCGFGVESLSDGLREAQELKAANHLLRRQTLEVLGLDRQLEVNQGLFGAKQPNLGLAEGGVGFMVLPFGNGAVHDRGPEVLQDLALELDLSERLQEFG